MPPFFRLSLSFFEAYFAALVRRENRCAIIIPCDKSSTLQLRGRQKKVCSRTTVPTERIQLLLRLAVSGTNNWASPPTLMVSQANCLFCGPSGGNNCVFSLFGSLPVSHIWKHPQAMHEDAWVSCLKGILLSHYCVNISLLQQWNDIIILLVKYLVYCNSLHTGYDQSVGLSTLQLYRLRYKRLEKATAVKYKYKF